MLPQFCRLPLHFGLVLLELSDVLGELAVILPLDEMTQQFVQAGNHYILLLSGRFERLAHGRIGDRHVLSGGNRR